MTTTSQSSTTPALVGSRRDRWKGPLFSALLYLCFAISIGTLFALLFDLFIEGQSRLNLDLITKFPSSRPANAGAESAFFGTIWIMVLVALFTLPVGISAAVYLEEYANKGRWYNRLIEVNIQNLAAVPSIVYGILGLAFLARFLGLGFSILAGSLTLSLLVLPVVIIASREAIKAVPDSFRQGSLALGATQWQTIRHHVLPNALPGMATGAILALSRAIGEAAPLLLLGALTFITFNPTGLNSDFTVLPIQIFNWVSRPQEEFRNLAAAASLLLLVLLIIMNSAAILIRNKYQRRF